MSKYFDLGDETLWNPSNGAGRLFLKQTEVFEAELKTPSGIGPGKYPGDPDTLAVDQAAYAEFVRALVAWYCRTGHTVILALSEGFVATALALALARRAGIEVTKPEPVPGDATGGGRYDVQVPGNPQSTTTAVAAALETRAREMDYWMAR